MASSTLTAPPTTMDHLDAARALLDVSPSARVNSSGGTMASSMTAGPKPFVSSNETASSALASLAAACLEDVATGSSDEDSAGNAAMRAHNDASEHVSNEQQSDMRGGGALDALAALATKEHIEDDSHDDIMATHRANTGVASASSSSANSDDDDDAESMPPPPPRVGGGRRRSASNPEGMEKWDPYFHQKDDHRRHFMLPADMLEMELADASARIQEQAAAQQLERDAAVVKSQPPKRRRAYKKRTASKTIPEDQEMAGEELEDDEGDESSIAGDDVDEADLTADELLRRARSRLLEDLSQGSVGHGSNSKGVITLPHSLNKYKDLYSKNGRIGIYTPAERAATIARYQDKRTRRVWNKKIRYNCRKSLADRRLRVKGRFVKRSEQEQLARQLEMDAADTAAAVTASRSASDESEDEAMPDVNDPEAGFAPTEDQPYRRLRRHTIT